MTMAVSEYPVGGRRKIPLGYVMRARLSQVDVSGVQYPYILGFAVQTCFYRA